MKLYIREVNCCEECPYMTQLEYCSGSTSSFYVCDAKNERPLFENFPDIPEWCPLEDVIKK